MRTGLTAQATNILSANVKKVAWLFDINLSGHSTVDYHWSTQSERLGSNLITNSTNEAAVMTPVTAVRGSLARSADQAYAGTYSAKYVASADVGAHYTYTPATLGTMYKVSVWVYLPSGQTTTILSLNTLTGPANQEVAYTTTTDQWVQLTGYVTTTASAIGVIGNANSCSGDVWYLDNMEITEVLTPSLAGYSFKIMGFDPITLNMGSPESGVIPPTKTTIKVSFPSERLDSNLIINSDNEASVMSNITPFYGTLAQSSTQKYDGSYSAKYIASADVQAHCTYTDVVLYAMYKASVWVWLPSGQATTELSLRTLMGPANQTLAVTTLTDQWVLLTGYVTATSNTIGVIGSAQNCPGDYWYQDNLSVQKVLNPDNITPGLYASDFKGASVTVRLVCGAYLEPVPAPGDTDEITATPDYQECEIMAWRFKVLSSHAVDQVMTWECQDFFTLYLEGDYPNTPLVSDLFRADIMKADNVCVPLAFGQPFFPVRWIPNNLTATYVDADTFTVTGDKTALFSAGQHLMAYCGVDGSKSCWVSSSSYGGGVTTVNLIAASDDLTANLATVQTDHYLLGASGPTYTIDRARTPLEQSGKTTYLPADYIFKQDTVTGSDSASYSVVQLLCDDANKDLVNDANGFWGVIGSEIYDMPCRFSRSDLATMTSPPNIAEYIWESWGIPSAEIDAVSQAAAVATYAARGLELNIGLWYQQSREKLIAKLFSVSGMIPIIRDTVGFKVLTKTPQLIIEEDLIQPGSFSIAQAGYTRTQTDSGYVTWQIGTEPVVQVNKSVVACKATMVKKSDTTIECDWIQDAVKAQKSGKLALQRILLKDQTIILTAQAKILQLEPGDMIRINPANLGAEGAAYDCLIAKMTIHEGLWIDVECEKFSAALDDWDDLSISDIVVSDANTDKAYTPVYQGPVDAAGNSPKITGAVLIGNNGEFKTNIDPATNGGFVVTNTSLTCYNSTGGIRFRANYGADGDQGDVTFGDYAGGKGIKWDQGDAECYVKGKLTVTAGSDIAGWLTTATEIKKITSNAGISLNSATPALVVTDANGYERVLLGKSGTNYGLTVKDESNNIIININDTNKNIAGWTVDAGKMYNTNCFISSASYISFGNTPPTAYGNNAGVWLGWTAGMTAKAQLSLYTDANNYFQFDGGKVLVKSPYFEIDAAGKLTCTEASIRGTLNADDITVGNNISAKTFQTAGTRLTQATVGSDSTVYVADTSLFPSSGYGWIYDTTVDIFAYTGKTSTTLTGCTGVSATPHASGLAVGGQFKRAIISSLDNEMHFFGDRGDGTNEELASIGIKSSGGDYVVGYFGSSSSGNNRIGISGRSYAQIGVHGMSYSYYGVRGESTSGIGVLGGSSTNYGGYFFGGKAPVCLQPAVSSSAPSGEAGIGAVWMTSGGIPYFNMDGSTTWYETVLASLKGTFVWDPGVMNNATGTSVEIEVTGADLGDSVIVFPPYDGRSVIITGYVSSANHVVILLFNVSGGGVDFAEGTWKYKIIKY